jgi:hypothetical protein
LNAIQALSQLSYTPGPAETLEINEPTSPILNISSLHQLAVIGALTDENQSAQRHEVQTNVPGRNHQT